MAWLLTIGSNEEIWNPTWTQIQEAILEMDGIHSNEVEVKLEDTGSLIIGGGDGKRYIVVYIPEDDSEEAYSVTLVGAGVDGVTAKAAGIPYKVKGQNWLKKWIDFNRAILTDPEGEVDSFMKSIRGIKYV